MRTVLWTQFGNCCVAWAVLAYLIAQRSPAFDLRSFFAGATFSLALCFGTLAWFYPPRKDEP